MLSANQRNITSVHEFTTAVRQSRQSGKVFLLVKHGDVSQFAFVPFE
jgi:hypothetical protein